MVMRSGLTIYIISDFLTPKSFIMLSNKPDRKLSGKISSCGFEAKGHRGSTIREKKINKKPKIILAYTDVKNELPWDPQMTFVSGKQLIRRLGSQWTRWHSHALQRTDFVYTDSSQWVDAFSKKIYVPPTFFYLGVEDCTLFSLKKLIIVIFKHTKIK